MTRTRPRLPLNALRAFEAAARTLSFKDAAMQLGVTPASVSNQIRQLERDWDVQLFIRTTRQVELTPSGHTLAQALGRAFDQMEAALDNVLPQGLQSRQQHLQLAVGPLFGTRWLAPRLSRFHAAYPHIALHLTQATPIASPQQLVTDAAIDWGTGTWPGLDAMRLFDCWLAPVISPALLAQGPGLQQPLDVARYPVLHQQTRADWAAWMQQAQVAGTRFPRETVMADSNMVTQAAIDGQGIALGVFPLVQADVDSGRLVCPWEIHLHTGHTYHLLMPPGTVTQEPARSLWNWMQQQATAAQGRDA